MSSSSQKSSALSFGGAYFSPLAGEGVYNEDVPDLDISGT